MYYYAISSLVLSLVARAGAQTYSATYMPSDAPDHTQQGQYGTNACGVSSSQSSMCQNAYLNSVDDFCLFAPPYPGSNSTIGDTERIEVSWCLKDGYGTRVIPDGSITGAHFVQTPDYIQVMGVGDLTQLNIPAGDTGGELDPHGQDGNGNPIGGLVFSNAFGQLEQLHEWTNFMSDRQFCFRACKPGPMATTYCQHIYDVMGCDWNMPGNYDAGVFERCLGDDGEPMGVYGTSTFKQGQPTTPSAHPAPPTSMCTTYATVGNGIFIRSVSTATNVSAVASIMTTSSPNSLVVVSGTSAISRPTATATIIPPNRGSMPTGLARSSYSGARSAISPMSQVTVILGAVVLGIAFCF
ncbi:uncharacterized protein LAESUDRAFT_745569 [Laetiporus sulphureus 93-53]|uniref:Carbohydrate-binding module family 13 protein n=1 Tax=Laetiporus sulphureus 93-53 TaxID=1314785 RepID=A0A165BH36_9APHY|nr:uncharacterized protein LAESUDRAFT_745569 [Laetiporus sulphureus 93-53]KZT01043.1 hypothetical protein LAESUDRAFT_745569 [Laetiporus sulphureus 93-53]